MSDPTRILLLAIIQAAIRDYRKDRYPSGYYQTRWVSPRIDALSYFHSEAFINACLLLDVTTSSLFRRYEIPEPTPDCFCEECRRDYSREALLVLGADDLAVEQSPFRFLVNHRHLVDWRVTGWQYSIVAIMPIDAEKKDAMTAREYLRECIGGPLPDEIMEWSFVERLKWYESKERIRGP